MYKQKIKKFSKTVWIYSKLDLNYADGVLLSAGKGNYNDEVIREREWEGFVLHRDLNITTRSCVMGNVFGFWLSYLDRL